MRPVPRLTRQRQARELAAARRALRRASNRANQAATWCLFCYLAVLLAVVSAYRCGQKADQIERHMLQVVQVLKRQTDVLLTRTPATTEATE